MRRDLEAPEVTDSGKQGNRGIGNTSPSLGAPDGEARNRLRTDLFRSATSRAQL